MEKEDMYEMLKSFFALLLILFFPSILLIAGIFLLLNGFKSIPLFITNIIGIIFCILGTIIYVFILLTHSEVQDNSKNAKK